jgi:hypothetical protein
VQQRSMERRVCWSCELSRGAVVGRSPGMRRVLRTGRRRVVKLGECFLDVVGHGHVDGSCGVVLSESEAAVELARDWRVDAR